MALRKYITSADPGPFSNLIKMMSFSADNLDLPIFHQRIDTKDGSVALLRVNGIDHVTISPYGVGAWEMEFIFPGDSILGLSLLTLEIDFKKNVDGVDVRYWTVVPITLSMDPTTIPLYAEDGTKTTKYLQVDDIVFPAIDEDNRKISFSLSAWENNGTLGEEQESLPKRVNNLKFICYYGFNIPSSDYIPLPGYIVTKMRKNWHDFLEKGWIYATGKYLIDVTMVKESGDYKELISLEYLNNNISNLDYEASGDSIWQMSPLTSIQDDYDYTRKIKNYINDFYLNASTTPSFPQSLLKYRSYYHSTGTWVDWPDLWYSWPWNDMTSRALHPGLFKQNGQFSKYSSSNLPGAGQTMPYTYQGSVTGEIITDEDTCSNTLSISNPKQFDSESIDIINEGNPTQIDTYYTMTTRGITWTTVNRTMLWSYIQLPMINTKWKEGTKKLKKFRVYSAGTGGSPGEPG